MQDAIDLIKSDHFARCLSPAGERAGRLAADSHYLRSLDTHSQTAHTQRETQARNEGRLALYYNHHDI